MYIVRRGLSPKKQRVGGALFENEICWRYIYRKILYLPLHRQIDKFIMRIGSRWHKFHLPPFPPKFYFYVHLKCKNPLKNSNSHALWNMGSLNSGRSFTSSSSTQTSARPIIISVGLNTMQHQNLDKGFPHLLIEEVALIMRKLAYCLSLFPFSFLFFFFFFLWEEMQQKTCVDLNLFFFLFLF